MPPWVLNYYDLATYDSSFRTLLNGTQEPIFGFSEVFDSNESLLQEYYNKSINPADPNTVGGNRDVLDFPLYFAMDNNLTDNGFQNNWNNVINASVDAEDDGLANNGSEGVSFVSSADSPPPYLSNVAYAFTLTRPGNAIVYYNAQEFGTDRSFPQQGRGDALGGLYGDTITNLVNIRNTHPDGNFDERDVENNVLIYERDDSMLVGLTERPGAAPVPRRGLLGLYHFAILVPSREVLGRVLRHLAALGVHVGMADHLVSEALYLTDPDGLGIEIYADRPRESWKKTDRQIAMASDPLDIENLLAAGGDAPFTGLPAGTVIGHVHLHVGDIERASHFYHEGLGFDKMVWNYSGALFLAAGGYHHHLGTNTWAAGARAATDGDARLLEWEVQVPTAEDAHAALANLESAGHAVERDASGGTVNDPWGTKVRVRAT